MKAKIKYIIIIAVVALILGGAVVALTLTAPKEEETEDTSSASNPSETSLIFDKNPEDIAAVTITNEYGSYKIERTGQEGAYTWMPTDYLNAPVDMSVVDDICQKSATLTAQKTVVEDAPDLSIYGLKEPAAEYKVEFTDSSNTVCEVLVGNAVPGSSTTRYMCLKGENTVYTVKNTDISFSLNDKRNCVNKTVYTAYVSDNAEDTTNYSRINKMTVSRKDIDYDIVIEYDTRLDDPNLVVSNSSQYRITSPVVLDLNPDTCTGVTEGVFGLTASDFELIQPSEEDMAAYGFDDPTAVIDMDIVGGAFKMTVGNPVINEDGKQTGYYAYVDGIDVIYIFDTASLPWVTFMPLDITTSMITSNYIYGLTSMDITGTAVEAHFTMTGSSADDFVVKLSDGTEADLDAFKTFYQFILKAPAEQLCFDRVSGEPYIRIEITSGSNTDVLEFYTAENRRTVICLNGNPSFTCKTAYAERLAENVDSFLNGKDIILTW
ncbi:MAG: DUF4340 domain-containing protein [Oscillospiraceae bacterium]|nr:DUF4340 domain-containing protein [Oscillospiraceae bacterium]